MHSSNNLSTAIISFTDEEWHKELNLNLMAAVRVDRGLLPDPKTMLLLLARLGIMLIVLTISNAHIIYSQLDADVETEAGGGGGDPYPKPEPMTTESYSPGKEM